MQIESLSVVSQRATLRWWLVAVSACVLIVVGSLLLLMRVQNALVVSSDFTQDYVAAQAFLDGRTLYFELSPADLSAERLRIEQALIAPYPIVNFHPPFDALLFVPLALLPYNLAILVWAALSCALYLWIGATVLRELSISLGRHWQALLFGLGLCWYPFQAHIALGQLSLPVIACLIGCWVLLRGGRDGWAGVLLGLACLIKMYPGVLLLYLLLRRRWRALAAACAVGALGLALTLLLVGPGDVIRYFLEIAPRDNLEQRISLNNVSLTSVFSRLFTNDAQVMPVLAAPWLATLLIAMSSLIVVALLVYQLLRRSATPSGEHTSFALACLAMLLLSPITWQHGFPVLFLPFGLVFLDLRRCPARARIVLALLAATLVSLPSFHFSRLLVYAHLPDRIPWPVGLLLLAPTVGLALLWWLTATRLDNDDAVCP